jgi:hypothetical protein
MLRVGRVDHLAGGLLDPVRLRRAEIRDQMQVEPVAEFLWSRAD